MASDVMLLKIVKILFREIILKSAHDEKHDFGYESKG